jgi:hypothetical protein
LSAVMILQEGFVSVCCEMSHILFYHFSIQLKH